MNNTAKMQAKRERAAKRKEKIMQRVTELKAQGLTDVQVGTALEKELDMTSERAWLFAHGKTVLSIAPRREEAPGFMRDWLRES